MDELDRVFQSEDMFIGGTVYVVDDRTHGGRLTAAGGTGNNDHSPLCGGDFGHCFHRQTEGFEIAGGTTADGTGDQTRPVD